MRLITREYGKEHRHQRSKSTMYISLASEGEGANAIPNKETEPPEVVTPLLQNL